jgi:predicted transporter
MDLNIILWIGGMLFSLGIFAVKVGFGLGFSRMTWKGILITLSMYLMLFVAVAVLSGHLIKLLEPVLKKGPYLHAIMAIGMIGWGIYLLRKQKTEDRSQIKLKFKVQNSKINNSELSTRYSLLLLVPCPVCLTAMTFSTWAALSVIKLPSFLVGIGLGVIFALLTLIIVGLTRIKQTSSPEISLGLGMIAIGLYFMASLYLPAKIEEARGVYQSFLTKGSNIALDNSIGVFAILFVSFIIGYFVNKKVGVKK